MKRYFSGYPNLIIRHRNAAVVSYILATVHRVCGFPVYSTVIAGVRDAAEPMLPRHSPSCSCVVGGGGGAVRES